MTAPNVLRKNARREKAIYLSTSQGYRPRLKQKRKKKASCRPIRKRGIQITKASLIQ